MLDAECDRELAGHCRRSYQFAALIARAEEVAVDEEVLYLGTLLHDLGLARRYDGPERFDVRGPTSCARCCSTTAWSGRGPRTCGT